MCLLRFNHLYPPFNEKHMRQALLSAVNQGDFMSAIVGTDSGKFDSQAGVFTVGTPMASDAGLEPLRGPRDLDQARQQLRELATRANWSASSARQISAAPPR